ncbi:cupin [Rubrivivax gelatinosus]|nr:cupin [Rubrivivax gelatinosus]
MELLASDHFIRLANPGVESWQLLSPHNSASTRLTITRVVLAPGAEQPRHVHSASEQVWVAVAGQGTLLLADGALAGFAAGQVARFADGEVHGLRNMDAEPFVYLSITSPALDFSSAYREQA